ncbi:PIG-L family deacetylase [Kitasatospora kazusensis]|uniref:PIG-L family deacetylase n=1 Tax=Kitasatospora kazusensis TaxID=407974 RepID=A0ABP5LP90_9ACTN
MSSSLPYDSSATPGGSTPRKSLLRRVFSNSPRALKPGPNSSALHLWTDPGTIVQIVAHPDDDLYFINPDVRRAVESGGTVVTVVLTAAESDGVNLDTGYWARKNAKPDYATYSRARHNGLRRAYARMATGDPDSPWHRELVQLTDNVAMECDILSACQQLRLCLFQVSHSLRGERNTPSGAVHGLSTMWRRETAEASTLVVADSPVTHPQVFGHEDVTQALARLLEVYRPTVVRTLDPDPEHDGGHKDSHVESDHHEHTATAQYALEAVRRYREETGIAPVLEHYRAYANRFWAYNLSHRAASEKAELLNTYAGADGVPDPGADLGDFQLGPNPYRSTHLFSTAYRYAPTTSWLVRQSNGLLAAFAVQGGQVVHWDEQPETGDWDGPHTLDGDWIAPSLAVVAGRDGRTHLVGLRRTNDDTGFPTVDLVHRVRNAPGEPFGGWVSIGNPDAGEEDRRRQRELGVPAAAADATGRLHVFARNFAQGMSRIIEEPDRSWGKWFGIGGDFLQDAPVALTTASGRVELYVPGKQTIRRWYQATPSSQLLRDDKLTSMPAASGGITAVEAEPDRITLYFRQAGTAQVMAYRQQPQQKGWPGRSAGLGGHDGTGPIAVVPVPRRSAGDVLLAHRNAAGSLTVSLPPAPDAPGRPGPQWHDLSGSVTYAPAAALDAAGHAVLAVIGTDGRLHVARQTTGDLDSPFSPWLTV